MAVNHFILQHGDQLHATRGFPFYDKANSLTLNRIRDNPENVTLPPNILSDHDGMTIGKCINICMNFPTPYAGVEDGWDYCEFTSRSRGVVCRKSSIFVTSSLLRRFNHTRFGCQIVDIT